MTADEALWLYEAENAPAADALALWERGEEAFLNLAERLGRRRGQLAARGARSGTILSTAGETAPRPHETKRMENKRNEPVSAALRGAAAAMPPAALQSPSFPEVAVEKEMPLPLVEDTSAEPPVESAAAELVDIPESQRFAAVSPWETAVLSEEGEELSLLQRSLSLYDAVEEGGLLSAEVYGQPAKDAAGWISAAETAGAGEGLSPLNLTYRQVFSPDLTAASDKAEKIAQEITLFSGGEDSAQSGIQEMKPLTAEDVIEELERRLLWEMQGETEGVYR